MAKEKKKKKKNENKVSFFGYDPVEQPETIIESDKNEERKTAFKEAYKKVMSIIPEYFISERKKRKVSSTSSGGFAESMIVTPEIIVTPESVKIVTNVKEEKKEIEKGEKQAEKEIE